MVGGSTGPRLVRDADARTQVVVWRCHPAAESRRRPTTPRGRSATCATTLTRVDRRAGRARRGPRGSPRSPTACCLRHRPPAPLPGVSTPGAGRDGRAGCAVPGDRRPGPSARAGRSPPTRSTSVARARDARPGGATRARWAPAPPLGPVTREPVMSAGRRTRRRGPPRTLLITLTGKDRPGVTSLALRHPRRLRRRGARRRADRPPRPAGARRAGHARRRDWRPLRDAVAATADRPRHGRRGRPTAPATTRRDREGRSPRHRARARRCARGRRRDDRRIADTGGNIDRIERMARYPVTAIELHVSGADPERLRARAGRGGGAPGRRRRRAAGRTCCAAAMRLVVMDVDSTLIQGEVIEMLAAHAGCEAEVAASHRARDARRARLRGVACARGSRCSRGSTPRPSTRSTTSWCSPRAPGRWCRTLQAARATGSRSSAGGFSHDHHALAAELGIDFSRRQRARDRRRPADRARRRRRRRPGRQGRRRCARFAARGGVPAARPSRSATARTTSTCSSAAGLGIAFNAKPVVREAADTRDQRALPRRDPLPARHQPRGGRGGRREAGLTTPAPPV